MRIRYIKPSITTCEDLIELGPYAYILFQGLWMLADRKGRFEVQPRRIKSLCMPMWDEVTSSVVEILVDKLAAKGFIELYLIEGKLLGTIVNWSKHQRPHTSEPASILPEPPRKPGRPKSQVLQPQKVAVLTDGEHSPPPRLPSRCTNSAAVTHGEWGMGNGELGMGNGELEAAALFVPGESEGTEEKSSPPLIEPKTPEPEKPKADPPPTREPADFGPHDIGSVNMLRESLTELGKLAGLSPPDDDILRQVLEAGHGARADDIHLEIVGMWKSGRLRTVRSWGLLPLVVGSAFT